MQTKTRIFQTNKKPTIYSNAIGEDEDQKHRK